MANSELDTLYKTETHTSTRSLTDEELMAGIIGAVRDTRQAMTQDAWKGNLKNSTAGLKNQEIIQ